MPEKIDVDASAYGPAGEAAYAKDASGRLLRVRVLEHSVAQAKTALSNAEIAMQSVHAGLALEPMAAAQAHTPLPPTPAPEASRIFDPSELHGTLQLSQVPLFMQALALILLGWCVAYAAIQALGPERSRTLLAAVRTQAVINSNAASTASKEEAATRLSSGEAPVIIYERSSPYPGSFSSLSQRERFCLAEAIYYEARGEPVAGQIAVAQVVLNRALAGHWPKNVCEVTHQGAENGEKCQFSYACMRRLLTKPFGDAWDNAQGLAEEILAGGAWLEEMLDATHFHRWDLQPVWRLSLVEVGRFGRHIFYNSPTENRRPLSKQAAR